MIVILTVFNLKDCTLKIKVFYNNFMTTSIFIVWSRGESISYTAYRSQLIQEADMKHHVNHRCQTYGEAFLSSLADYPKLGDMAYCRTLGPLAPLPMTVSSAWLAAAVVPGSPLPPDRLQPLDLQLQLPPSSWSQEPSLFPKLDLAQEQPHSPDPAQGSRCIWHPDANLFIWVGQLERKYLFLMVVICSTTDPQI